MSSEGRLSLPLRSPEDVIPHLRQAYHWKAGYSAHAVANSWFGADGIPCAVASVLDQVEWFRGSQLVDAFLERKTDLRDGCGAPSQTDLLAVVTADHGRRLAIVAVEAKVRESFGPLVHEWRNGSPTRETRLAKLCELLRLERDSAMALRYQLLHRAAAAIYEAEHYRQDVAALVVQSFCSDASGLGDFVQFAAALGFEGAGLGRMSNGRRFGATTLLLGWVADTLPEAA